jgi:cell division protein FtsW
MKMEKGSEEIEASVTSRALTLPMITVGILFLMGLWGCLAIYNATAFSNTPFHYAGRQLIWVILGIFVLWGSSHISFEKYEKYLWGIALLVYTSLILVLFTGMSINGMRGWFNLGFCLIQPSELAKPVYILTLCSFLKKGLSPFKLFISLLLTTIIWCIPLALQPDFGTMLVYLCGFLAVYILAEGRILYLIPVSMASIPFAFFIYKTKPYIVSRFTGFLNPSADPSGTGWHILQFQYTLARGGFSGQSWGNAMWSNAYLPLSYSDSSFASLVEAIGFAGTLPVILGFTALAFAGYRLSINVKEPERKIFIFAMPVLITSQALIHMSVNVGLLPPTGITLPMFSYGGSSLMSIMLSFGIILSASKRQQRL